MSAVSSTTALGNLAGHYQLRPGQQHSIDGARPIVGADRLSLLLRGLDQRGALQRLGQVFTLCGHAHQRAGHLVFVAASAGPSQTANDAAAGLMLLRWETLRDHLRAMALDWPQRLGNPGTTSPLAWLQGCPLSLTGPAPTSDAEAGAAIQAFKSWLEERVLGTNAAGWLVALLDADALGGWCQQQAALKPPLGGVYPVVALAHWHDRAAGFLAPLHGLDVLDDDAAVQQQQMMALAAEIATTPGFVQCPEWHGSAAETGPWTRLRNRRSMDGAYGSPTRGNVWARLASRWMELIALAAAPVLPDAASQDPLLSSGAVPLGGGQAIAWCEMARGLLVHWLQIDANGLVQQYRVLAPTEWNFHPSGALAGAVAELEPDDRSSATLLAAAFDPCVECLILTPQQKERVHA